MWPQIFHPHQPYQGGSQAGQLADTSRWLAPFQDETSQSQWCTQLFLAQPAQCLGGSQDGQPETLTSPRLTWSCGKASSWAGDWLAGWHKGSPSSPCCWGMLHPRRSRANSLGELWAPVHPCSYRPDNCHKALLRMWVAPECFRDVFQLLI